MIGRGCGLLIVGLIRGGWGLLVIGLIRGGWGLLIMALVGGVVGSSGGCCFCGVVRLVWVDLVFVIGSGVKVVVLDGLRLNLLRHICLRRVLGECT